MVTFVVSVLLTLGMEGRVDTVMVGTNIGVGKVAPFGRGRGSVGPEAVPTGLPCPGNLVSVDIGEGIDLAVADAATEDTENVAGEEAVSALLAAAAALAD